MKQQPPWAIYTRSALADLRLVSSSVARNPTLTHMGFILIQTFYIICSIWLDYKMHIRRWYNVRLKRWMARHQIRKGLGGCARKLRTPPKSWECTKRFKQSIGVAYNKWFTNLTQI